MKIGSLFAGIGGLELGLERALPNARTIWQVEIDSFCREILAKHWPHASRYDDIRETESSALARVDLICGGFPCQDISVAGRGGGLAGERSGLWRDFARIVGDLYPRFVVVENVAHGRGRWLPFVRRDLCFLGYRTRAVQVSASDVGAPHRRERVFVIANADRESLRVKSERLTARRSRGVRGQGKGIALDDGSARNVAGASRWAARPALLRVDDGLSDRLVRARERAIGNAVSPAVSEVIGRMVREMIYGQQR